MDVIAMLLEGGVDVESRDMHGETPLCLAAANGQEDAVRLLLDKGANVNLLGEKSGQTPLFRALKKGHGSVTALLLEKGADPTLPSQLPGQPLLTPLRWAVNHGDEATVKLLLDHGAAIDMNPMDLWQLTRLAVKRQLEPIVPLLLPEKNTGVPRYPLEWELKNLAKRAIRLNSIAILKSLSEHADKMQWDLNLVVMLAKTECQSDGVIRFALGRHRHKINARDIWYDWTALHYASRTGNDVLARLLLDYGAAVNVKVGTYRVTPLWFAVYGRHKAVVEILLAAGADVKAKGQYSDSRSSVLGLVEKRRDEEMIQLIRKCLLARGNST